MNLTLRSRSDVKTLHYVNNNTKMQIPNGEVNIL